MQTIQSEASLKKLLRIQREVHRHWVGDGFPVRTLFSYSALGAMISPFLLFDYAGPMEFQATTQRRGVGEHPHRGFETVTIVYSGEVEHRDSSGGGGKIGSGDVQWMTAASGLVHEEFHSRDFAEHGGVLEMVQLWVNLPAKDKMSPPHYQSILDNQIPAINLPNDQGIIRVIAGEFAGVTGPAHTFTPINVWDLRLTHEQSIDLAVPGGYNTLLAVLKGSVRVNNGTETIHAAEVGLFAQAGDRIRIISAPDTTALLLCGEPIDEPIVGSGPFVMNSSEEIRQAMADYQSGKMGRIA
ncbi:MAG: pirin family protein [Nitrosomonas sp. PRO4]|nr:pirin family protein [Nitrosomonas sp. PRO4]